MEESMRTWTLLKSENQYEKKIGKNKYYALV
jgi:hypothetical protein